MQFRTIPEGKMPGAIGDFPASRLGAKIFMSAGGCLELLQRQPHYGAFMRDSVNVLRAALNSSLQFCIEVFN